MCDVSQNRLLGEVHTVWSSSCEKPYARWTDHNLLIDHLDCNLSL